LFCGDPAARKTMLARESINHKGAMFSEKKP
jgi:hypothetical protein